MFQARTYESLKVPQLDIAVPVNLKTSKLKKFGKLQLGKQKGHSCLSVCHAEYFYVLHSFPIFILLTCSIPVISMYTEQQKKHIFGIVYKLGFKY